MLSRDAVRNVGRGSIKINVGAPQTAGRAGAGGLPPGPQESSAIALATVTAI